MPLRRARRDASRLARLSNPAFPFLGFESNLVRDPKQNAPQGGVLFWIWRRGRDYSRLAPLALRARAARGSAHRFAVLVLAACAARARRLNDEAPGKGGLVISHLAEREGFEPSVRGYRTLTFQASPFDHSGTSPALRPGSPATKGGKVTRCNGKAQRDSLFLERFLVLHVLGNCNRLWRTRETGIGGRGARGRNAVCAGFRRRDHALRNDELRRPLGDFIGLVDERIAPVHRAGAEERQAGGKQKRAVTTHHFLLGIQTLIPAWASALMTGARFAPSSQVSGRRIPAGMRPMACSAHLTGMGLASTNSALCRPSRR